MDITTRTVFIVGATSGIGRELAHRFAAAGSTVIVGGRRTTALAELETEGFDTAVIDVADSGSVATARDAVLASHPSLDTVVTMAGLMAMEDLRDPSHYAIAESMVNTNLLGTIRVVDAFTPHLIEQGRGAFVTVTSGIAFLPFPPMASYAATKAGVHAYSEALRVQLADAGIEVVELVPPAVRTHAESVNPQALDLGDFAADVMNLLARTPTPPEILVEAVQMHRWAEKNGTYDALVAQRATMLSNLRARSAPSA